AINILARIKGTEEGKSLLLLSHYDSSPHSSYGASDAASGVATILEGVRAFLSENKAPKNDIIILISDAEELGLNGADLFVNKHPWAKDVGLVLNFEARGSGGPSYAFIETNRGNATLINEFIKANPQFPMANSLYYSIYKLLPNDTDLTVFREDRDLDGFNFAFIDDHYDYHTALDTYERLDRNTLTHQGSYLMPLLQHFSQADLSNLKSLNENVYFDFPFFKMVTYPFEWIWPMFALAIFLLLVFCISGLLKKTLEAKAMLKGFIPLFIALLINGVVGYFSWSVLKWMYPQYTDILHGFTYNGYTYIAAFVFFALGVCFWVYNNFKTLETPNLLIAPLVLWLTICAGLGLYLTGASFYIIPVFGLLVALFITIDQKSPNPYLLVFLALPALWLLSPLIKGIPVGLGLKMMVATTLLTTLTFVFLLPIFSYYKKKGLLAYLSLFLFAAFMVSAHLNSTFTKERPKPSSLLYVLDADVNTAQWATFEKHPSTWTTQYLGADKKIADQLNKKTLSSKYSTGFTYVNDAPLKELPVMKVEKTRDTVIGAQRMLDICISHHRPVNRLDVFTNEIPVEKAWVNSVPLSEYFLQNRLRNKLITHYISDNEYTDLQVVIPKDSVLELTLYEASNDLLDHPQFSISPRPENEIPMPFVLNDAVLVTKTIRFD
ncbi:MAG: M28 family peptidase, partial [Flavobacteriaceae bacterium]